MGAIVLLTIIAVKLTNELYNVIERPGFRDMTKVIHVSYVLVGC